MSWKLEEHHKQELEDIRRQVNDLEYIIKNPNIIPYHDMWSEIRSGKISFSVFVTWMSEQTQHPLTDCIGKFQDWNGG